MSFTLFNCVILNLPMHNVAVNLGLSHTYCLVARKTLWRLVGMYAMGTEFLLDHLILNG